MKKIVSALFAVLITLPTINVAMGDFTTTSFGQKSFDISNPPKLTMPTMPTNYKEMHDLTNKPLTFNVANTATDTNEEITPTGIVLEPDNQAAIGANVVLVTKKGENPGKDTIDASTGRATDLDGKFTLPKSIKKGSIIRISYVGFQTEYITVNQADLGTITLKDDNVMQELLVEECRKPANAKKVTRIKKNENDEKGECIITSCEGDFEPDSNGKSCIPKGNCDPDKTTYPHASKGKYSGGVCYPIDCEKGFNCQNKGTKDAKCEPATCKIKHLKGTAHTKVVNGMIICKADSPAECETPDRYTFVDGGDSSDDKCDDQKGSTCKYNDKDIEHQDSKLDKNGKCIFGCVDGYTPNEDDKNNPYCEANGRKCDQNTDSDWPKYATSAYKNKKGVCMATACGTGFTLKSGKCECGSECKVNADGSACDCPQLSTEDAEARRKELEENAQKMKENEQSTANKMLGGLAIGATSIGGMQALSAMAEKDADEEAERNMKNYLATFKCGYGQGLNIKGGNKDIALPTSSEIPPLVTEYRQIAENLKITKEQLDMMPGIEAELIIDASTTGLYDDVGIGKTGGAFTSLYRALTDENSEDAKAWAEQKAATAKKLKTGAILAGVGIVGGAIGNIAINHGKGDKSQEILNKYKNKKVIVTTPIVLDRRPCSDYPGASPKYQNSYVPECVCDTEQRQYFKPDSGCEKCDEHYRVNDARNGCTCDETQGYREINGKCQKPTSDCNLDGIVDLTKTPCECKDGTEPVTNNKGETECRCKTGYRENDDKTECKKCDLGPLADPSDACKCNADRNAHVQASADGKCECEDGYENPNNSAVCVEKAKAEETTPPATKEQPIVQFTVQNEYLPFATGKYNIDDKTCANLIDQITKKEEFTKSIDLWKKQSDKTVCAIIAGHTDFTGGNKDTSTEHDRKLNEDLSVNRANSLKACLEKPENVKKLFGDGVTYANIQTVGMWWTQCTADGYAKGDRPKYKPNAELAKRDIANCRRVEINLGYSAKACAAINSVKSVKDYAELQKKYPISKDKDALNEDKTVVEKLNDAVQGATSGGGDGSSLGSTLTSAISGN